MNPLSVGVSLWSLFLLPAEQPILINGRIELLGAPADLRSELARLSPSAGGSRWVGYRVPMLEGRHHLCGDGDHEDVVRLDDDRGRQTSGEERSTSDLIVLYRLEARGVTRVRAVSADCRTDAGGNVLGWLEGVDPGASLAALESVVSQGGDAGVAEQAILAIAFHGGREADGSLERVASTGEPELRKKAVFWLGAVRGDGGFPILVVRLRDEPHTDVREQIVFALNLSSANGAMERLIDTARGDRDAKVRARALFWLSQKAGKRAAEAIASAVRDDPEIEIKKKAVFALSQLPPDEGVPLLIEVAENHPNREVRKQAFFWLGQSHDARALSLFERILREK